MKCAGSSIELALIPHCGDKDIITGSGYEDELIESNFLYTPKNNLVTINEIASDGSKINAVEPIYHTHTTPEVLREKYVDYNKIADYYHFSIVRNPFDALISYFWWSFYGPDVAKLSIVTDENGVSQMVITGSHAKPKYEYSLGKVIMPMIHDSDVVLRIKFQQFLESNADFLESDRIGSEKNSTSILDWFSKLQWDFCGEHIDNVLTFETLSQDVMNVCDKLGINIDVIPKLKSSQRKVNKPYDVYYNAYTKDMAHEAFNNIIKKFNYTF
jgi:hypothetical protein